MYYSGHLLVGLHIRYSFGAVGLRIGPKEHYYYCWQS
jgi:hypothetical protein